MARIITSQLQHFDPMARGGEQVVTSGGPKFAKRGLFGGDMDITELNQLNAAIKSGMGIAKDVWPTVKGVVDPPMKKIQEMMQQSDIKDARAKAAAELALKDKALPLNRHIVGTGTPPAGQEVFQEDVTEVETRVPLGRSRQEVDKKTFASLRELATDTNQKILSGLYERYSVTPGDRQGLASAITRAKRLASGKGATPIDQDAILQDEKMFVQALSPTSERGEPGSPLRAYQDMKRDAARSRAMHQARSGNYSDAAKSFLSAYQMDPEPIAIYNAAQSRLKAGDLAGAKDLFVKAAMHREIPPERKAKAIQTIGSIDSMMSEAASQPARPAAPMPSATGARVTPLQASTSGAPMRSAPAPAGQRAMRPTAQAAPTAPAAPASQVGVGQMDRQLLTDPTNRAFVRTVLAEMKARGQEEDLGYAMDQLRLEIAKRGTKAPTMIDESVREVLTMDPGQAASGMDMMGMYALADQSTVADWPKIEPIARRVIAARPRGFLELIGMEDELLKVYNRLGKPGGTPGVEFDLKGIAERGLKGAQALKARGRRRKGVKPSKYSRSSLDRYLTNRDDRTMVGGKIVPVTVSETNAKYEKLIEEIESGRFTGKRLEAKERLRDKILERRSQKNNEFKIKEARTLDEKTRSQELTAKLEGDLLSAQAKERSLKEAIRESPQPYSPQEISKGVNKEARSAMRAENSRRRTALDKLKKELRDVQSLQKGLIRQVQKGAPTQNVGE